MTATLRRTGALVPVIACASAVAGVLVGSGVVGIDVPALAQPVPHAGWLVLAVAVVTAAQLPMLRVRIGAGAVGLAWGESAVVILCVLVPAAWIPPVVLAGVGVARVIQAIRRPEYRKPAAAVWGTAMLTLAGGAAALAAGALTVTYRHPLTPRVALALVLAAAAYAATGLVMVSWRMARLHGDRFALVAGRALASKLPMLVGNVAVGLLVVVLYGVSARWLALLLPALWLLHQAYAYRLRAGDERRSWQTFADATRALNRLDGREAAGAGIRGALRLFGGEWARLSVTAPDGRVRAYEGTPGSEVAEGEPTGEAGAADEAGTVARDLSVGGVRVGELRIRMRPGVRMGRRDQLMFAAYADALAAALHDAATHHELRAIGERSSRELVHDSLTGLVNRTGFMATGDAALRKVAGDAPVALLLLDLDHFKEVNDTLGHGAGDLLLQVAASRLEAAVGPGELLARLGGDEFAMFLPTLAASGAQPVDPPVTEYPAQSAHVLARARDLAGVLATPSEVAGVQLSVEASVGVVVAAAGAVDLTELLRRADIAMYQAKRGGSSVARYDPARDRASTDRLALLAEVREALATDDQFTLAMQPAVRLGGGGVIGGGVIGVEALVRWKHPRRGALLPADFVPVIEHSELLADFTRYTLDHALAAAASWAAEGIEVPVAVNLSPRSLLDRALPEVVATLLARHGIRADRLVLEITETVVMSEPAVVDDVLSAVRRLGVQLAVDDFGTGYSSLTFLTRVAVDEIKIDRGFVRRMVDSPEVGAIVRAIVDLAHRLGLRVIAEGVETAEQRAALTALGCTGAQGYFFHPPLPPERVVKVLRELTTAPVIKLRDEDVS